MAMYKHAKTKVQILLYTFSILLLVLVFSFIVLDSTMVETPLDPVDENGDELPVVDSWERVSFHNYRLMSNVEMEGDGVLFRGRGMVDLELEPGTYNLSYWISICPDYSLEYVMTYQDQTMTYNPLRERVLIEDGVLVKERKGLSEYFETLVEERVYVVEVNSGEEVLLSKPISQEGSEMFEVAQESTARFSFRSKCEDATLILRLFKQE